MTEVKVKNIFFKLITNVWLTCYDMFMYQVYGNITINFIMVKLYLPTYLQV